jgi:GT2 family glycosyltransferase
MKIGIIVPFYNGHQWLGRLIESFGFAARKYECTLLIIDNSPGNRPVDTACRFEMKVKVLREKPGIGYGKAINRGYDHCKELGYDCLIVSNQDGYVSDNFIQEILSPFQQDDKILLTAPLLRMYDSNAVEDFFLKYYLSQVPELVSDLIEGRPRDYYEMNKISGACFAFNLKSKQYSYPYFFDPLFHMYFEDEDLCHRVQQVKGKIVLVPDAVFFHQHANTTDAENRQGIEADKLVSEKILRLKNGSKSSVKVLYGIFVATISSFTYHILRGELKKAYLPIRSFAIILYKLPAILKTRRQDILCSKTIG